ncbi:hypothetical protein D0T12_06345 [Actinomadura spongiicola]|uniref:Uncharacterized protein n=1 Tax=Actinomadura spongiicola TaxID=2303421 RepID=A0A372GM32_9ACTN|nr:hypothetical protein D0T12_06345 [Actinomadura spongiicola]
MVTTPFTAEPTGLGGVGDAANFLMDDAFPHESTLPWNSLEGNRQTLETGFTVTPEASDKPLGDRFDDEQQNHTGGHGVHDSGTFQDSSLFLTSVPQQ